MDETINELLDEINQFRGYNIDNIIYFYSSLLEIIASKKIKFEKDEALFNKQIKRISSVKCELLEEDSDETSESD